MKTVDSRNSSCVGAGSEAIWAAFVGCLVVLADTGVAYPAAPDDVKRLADIIENVRANELLYENREVIGEVTYRHVSPVTPALEKLVLTGEDERFRHVAQSGLIYLDIRGKQRTSSAESVTGVLEGYDGKRTIICERGSLASIDDGVRYEHPQILRPHTILLYAEFVSYPLSTFLTGRDAILAHPNGAGFPSNPFELTYLGEEEVSGLSCHKIVADFYSSRKGEKPKRTVRRFLWLAPARNYLPVREMCYELQLSADMETGEGVLEDLREIAPGVWFPFSAVCTAYDKQVMLNEKRREVWWKRTWTIKSASLDPKYDIGFFRDIAIPEGIPVSESENGRLVRTFISGSRDDPDAATRVPAAGVSHPIRWLLALASVGAFGGFVLVRWLRNKARASA